MTTIIKIKLCQRFSVFRRTNCEASARWGLPADGGAVAGDAGARLGEDALRRPEQELGARRLLVGLRSSEALA